MTATVADGLLAWNTATVTAVRWTIGASGRHYEQVELSPEQAEAIKRQMAEQRARERAAFVAERDRRRQARGLIAAGLAGDKVVVEGDLGLYSDDDYAAVSVEIAGRMLEDVLRERWPEFDWEMGGMGCSRWMCRARVTVEILGPAAGLEQK